MKQMIASSRGVKRPGKRQMSPIIVSIRAFEKGHITRDFLRGAIGPAPEGCNPPNLSQPYETMRLPPGNRLMMFNFSHFLCPSGTSKLLQCSGRPGTRRGTAQESHVLSFSALRKAPGMAAEYLERICYNIVGELTVAGKSERSQVAVRYR